MVSYDTFFLESSVAWCIQRILDINKFGTHQFRITGQPMVEQMDSVIDSKLSGHQAGLHLTKLDFDRRQIMKRFPITLTLGTKIYGFSK